MPTNDKAPRHPSAKSQVPEVTRRPPLAWPVVAAWAFLGYSPTAIGRLVGYSPAAVVYHLRKVGLYQGVRRGNPDSPKFWYAKGHHYVRRVRGRPQECEHCGTTSPKADYEWASVSGDWMNPADYLRLCRPCHAKFDVRRRFIARYGYEPFSPNPGRAANG